uniref:Fatty acid desaturase domain-containing protein n=2 Tax=Aureoumbra lagunensis TaxID=44058 RepID=A0A7S3NLF9_9STRA|mmetsp:Transcript_14850/g.22355  ORF Transcript_14850/g.22355 Transcript_14850/m.22355 type:complete len:227 (-) Transcript_14850:139-819(-)
MIRANKLYSILVANLPIGIPYAASFKPYHMDHHKYQGVKGVDTDLPTELEGKLFSSLPGKAFFATFQILFYALRPMMVKFQPLTYYHLLNIVAQVAFDLVLVRYFGMGALFYLVVSTLFAGSGLHPCAAHFIAEHYVFAADWETYSYYGWLNFFCFNVGYHNEHHDFPNIAWSKLPSLRKLASEYYDHLPYHESWPMVTWKFVFDPEVAVWNRVKRHTTNRAKKSD